MFLLGKLLPYFFIIHNIYIYIYICRKCFACLDIRPLINRGVMTQTESRILLTVYEMNNEC